MIEEKLLCAGILKHDDKFWGAIFSRRREKFDKKVEDVYEAARE